MSKLKNEVIATKENTVRKTGGKVVSVDIIKSAFRLAKGRCMNMDFFNQLPAGTNYTTVTYCSLLGIYTQVEQVFEEFNQTTRTFSDHIKTLKITSACKILLSSIQEKELKVILNQLHTIQ
jgi:hypothetical protein